MHVHYDTAHHDGLTLDELSEIVAKLYSVGAPGDTKIRSRSMGGPVWGRPGLNIRRIYAEIPEGK